MVDEENLVVLGGGPGGYAAAFAAADLGLSVTLVDTAENPGGVCLYRGCIPSKTLLHVAAVLREAREVSAFGVAFQDPKIDLDKLRAQKDAVVGKLTGGLGQLARQRKIRYMQGRGHFADPHSLHVDLAAGGSAEISFEHAIIATGSLPRTLPALRLESPRVWDSTAALELREVPKHLLVVGGGYIGAELATVYAALGAEVTVVEVTAGLLPGVDEDLVRPLAQRMGKEMRVLLSTRVASLQEKKNGLSAELLHEDGSKETLVCDAVLVSVGRAPQTEGIGLQALGITPDQHGFLAVDAQRRTALPHIFAIGDVAGQPMLAHKASYEGRVAAEAAAGQRSAYDPAAIPAVVFTDPEIAWAGLTERDAAQQGIAVKVSRFPWAASGRATTLGRSDGLTKFLTDPESGRVLGVGIAGPGAGELIAEGVLAIEMGAVAEDLARTIHPHPTLSETVMEAAEGSIGRSTHYFGR